MKTTTVRRALLTSLIAILPTLATAGTIGISDGKLIVGTEAGDGPQAISAAVTATDLLISGVNLFDLVTPGCATLSGTVTCGLSGFSQLIVLGGDGDDAITLSAIAKPTFATLILGGAGADILVGSGGDDIIFGGLGDDVLIGGPGQDCLDAGPGDNTVIQFAPPCGGEPDIRPLPRDVTVTPEPAELAPLGAGLGAVWIADRRRRRARQASPVQ